MRRPWRLSYKLSDNPATVQVHPRTPTDENYSLEAGSQMVPKVSGLPDKEEVDPSSPPRSHRILIFNPGAT
jgi:hypothetical protein